MKGYNLSIEFKVSLDGLIWVNPCDPSDVQIIDFFESDHTPEELNHWFEICEEARLRRRSQRNRRDFLN